MSISNKTLKVIGFALIASVVGAAAGILFAPHKGSKTRRKLAKGAKEMAEDFKDKIKDEAKEVTSKIEKLEDQAKDGLDDIIKGVKKKLNGLVHY